MLGYRITSDSTVDLTPERMEELGVPYVQLHYTVFSSLPHDFLPSCIPTAARL